MSKFAAMRLKQNRLTFYLFLVCLLPMMVAGIQSCEKSKPKHQIIPGAPITINKKKSGDQINLALRYSRIFQQDSPGEVLGKIETLFQVPANNGPLALGSSVDNKFAWLSLQIINPDNQPTTITLKTTHIRCDRLEVYRFSGNRITAIGDLSRSTPVSLRPYRGQEFAFPIVVGASDTARILMRTTRLIGAMEVDFRLYDAGDFPEHQFWSRMYDIFNLSFVLIVSVLSLVAGFSYRNRLLTYFAFFLMSTLLVYSFLLNFWDGFELPPFSALRNHNLGCFFAFLQGALFHPFGNEILKSYGITVKSYQKFTSVLFVTNLLLAATLLIISAEWVNVLFVRSYTLLTLTNISCLFFITIKLYRETGEKWLLIIALLTFAPTLIYLPVRFFSFNEQFYAAIVPPNIPMMAGLLAFFAVKQLRRQLTSKAELELRITQTKMDMNEMRKEEVQKIGRNLHDQLGNTLASVLGYVNMAVPDIPQVQKLLKQAIQEIRFTSHNLVKDENHPLSGKIGTIIDRFNDFSAIHFQFYDFSEGKIDQLEEVQQQNIYLIIQELLTNAVRYSNAQEMVVQVFLYGNSLQFNIEEDGAGFDPEQETDGLGIKNMFKRAELAGLQLTIESSPGNGTNVIILTG